MSSHNTSISGTSFFEMMTPYSVQTYSNGVLSHADAEDIFKQVNNQCKTGTVFSDKNQFLKKLHQALYHYDFMTETFFHKEKENLARQKKYFKKLSLLLTNLAKHLNDGDEVDLSRIGAQLVIDHIHLQLQKGHAKWEEYHTQNAPDDSSNSKNIEPEVATLLTELQRFNQASKGIQSDLKGQGYSTNSRDDLRLLIKLLGEVFVSCSDSDKPAITVDPISHTYSGDFMNLILLIYPYCNLNNKNSINKSILHDETKHVWSLRTKGKP